MEANSAAMLTKSSSPFVIDSVERLDEGAAKEEIGPGQAITTSVDCWSRFHQWFHCFCVVTFDLELGQTIEVVYPGDAPFSAQERSDLCYASFPDSNSTASPSHGHSPILKKGHLSSEQGPSDSMHHFRIRRTSLNEQNNPSNLEEFVPASLLPDPRFFHCVSFFRRQRDTCLPRGYFQKSIVLVSILPFVPFFQRILSEVAFAFFANGETAIETVCFQIDRHWPPPTSVGCELSLPLFGHHFQYIIPAELGSNMTPKCEKLLLFSDDREISGSSADDVVGLSDDNNNKNVIEAAEQQFHEVIRLLQPHLQLIWELVLLGEPLLIVAPTASLSSTLVNALVSLIKPLRYCGDYRPFFTIHDSDFTELSVRQNCCVNNFVLGVTNPFFLKAFAHWPHILRIGPYFTTNSLLRSPQRNSDGSEWQTETENDNGGEGLQNERREIERIFIVRTQKTIKRLSNHAHFDRQNMGGLLSTHRQFLVMDKLLTRNLHKMSNDFASQWHLLKRHFAKLTQSFISPLERFIASLLPLRSHLCPFQPVPSMRSFSLDHFLSTLQHFGHPGVKGDWQGLYRQFVTRSPNFIGWLQQRRKHIERQLNEEYLELLCTANLSSGVLRQRSQVEIVDLVLKFRDRLAELEQYCSKEEQLDQHKKQRRIFSLSPMKKLSVVDRQRKQLQQQLNCILSLVDDELKNLLMSNNTLRRAVIKNMDDHRNQCS